MKSQTLKQTTRRKAGFVFNVILNGVSERAIVKNATQDDDD
jgi:hypothetical protein